MVCGCTSASVKRVRATAALHRCVQVCKCCSGRTRPRNSAPFGRNQGLAAAAVHGGHGGSFRQSRFACKARDFPSCCSPSRTRPAGQRLGMKRAHTKRHLRVRLAFKFAAVDRAQETAVELKWEHTTCALCRRHRASAQVMRHRTQTHKRGPVLRLRCWRYDKSPMGVCVGCDGPCCRRLLARTR